MIIIKLLSSSGLQKKNDNRLGGSKHYIVVIPQIIDLEILEKDPNHMILFGNYLNNKIDIER